MKAILFLLVLNLIVISAQRFDQSVAPRPRRCSRNNRNSCPPGYTCRTTVFCFRAPCPQARPTCQRNRCQDLRCPPGLICRDRGSRPARCVRSTGRIGNSCPSGSVQIGNRRCFSSTQCRSSRRSFCNNRGGFTGGICCSRSNQFGGQKPGRCPRRRRNQNQSTTCDVRCTSDNQCRGIRKCCEFGCRRACREPDFGFFPF